MAWINGKNLTASGCRAVCKYGWLVIACGLLPVTAQAYIEGEMVPEGGARQYYVDLGNNGIDNIPGATRRFEYNFNSNFYLNIYCTRSITGETYFHASTSLPASPSDDNYLQLSEFLDVRTEIWVAGKLSKYIPVPFDNVSTLISETCSPPLHKLYYDFSSGSKGTVTLRVRKKMINGIEVRDQLLTQLYGRLGAKGGWGTTPMAQIYLQAARLQVPDKCAVNAGQEIKVEFGAVDSGSLDGNHYTRDIPVKVTCSGGSFDEGSLNISLRLAGDPAPFNGEMLKTSRDNLGIRLTHNGQPVVPGRYYPQPGLQNGGEWNLQATPQAKPGTEVAEGEFNASAILVSSFQ